MAYRQERIPFEALFGIPCVCPPYTAAAAHNIVKSAIDLSCSDSAERYLLESSNFFGKEVYAVA